MQMYNVVYEEVNTRVLIVETRALTPSPLEEFSLTANNWQPLFSHKFVRLTFRALPFIRTLRSAGGLMLEASASQTCYGSSF